MEDKLGGIKQHTLKKDGAVASRTHALPLDSCIGHHSQIPKNHLEKYSPWRQGGYTKPWTTVLCDVVVHYYVL